VDKFYFRCRLLACPYDGEFQLISRSTQTSVIAICTNNCDDSRLYNISWTVYSGMSANNSVKWTVLNNNAFFFGMHCNYLHFSR
jgi:hypothetical protein